MKAAAAVANLSKADPVKLALGGGILLLVVYVLARKTLGDAAGAAGGIVSGNNAVTKGTDYEGAGIAGTLGAVFDAATGGILGGSGRWIAGLLATDTAGEDLYYTTTFPDNTRHSVPSRAVARNGSFTVGTDDTWPVGTRYLAGQRFILGTLNGRRVARAA